MNAVVYFGPDQDEYLSATVKVFFDELKKHGICVHFATNNQYANPDAVLKLFDVFFETCGIIQFDAYDVANKLKIVKGSQNADYNRAFSEHKSDIAKVLNYYASRGNEEKIHYAILFPGGEDDDFEALASAIGKPGVMTFFQDGDADSSQIKVFPFTY